MAVYNINYQEQIGMKKSNRSPSNIERRDYAGAGANMSCPPRAINARRVLKRVLVALVACNFIYFVVVNRVIQRAPCAIAWTESGCLSTEYPIEDTTSIGTNTDNEGLNGNVIINSRDSELFSLNSSKSDLLSSGVSVYEDALSTVLISEDGLRTEKERAEYAARPRDGKIHITHVFNSFRVPATSKLAKEHAIVRLSWQLAAEYALQVAGIQVEFINALLPMDKGSGPSFATEVELSNIIVDPFNNHKLPTVGEIFRVGRDYGNGKYLIYTNADIGVHRDFYVQAWELAHRDATAPDLQERLRAESFELLNFCLNFDETGGAHITTPALCQNDARIYYKLHGGDPAITPLAMQDLAWMYVQNCTQKALQSPKPSTPTLSMLKKWFAEAGGQGSGPLTVDAALNYSPQIHVLEGSERDPPLPRAFTITRMDLQVNQDDVTVSKESLDQMLGSAKAAPHPGNDCFIFPRNMVPEMIIRSKHPLSWRPWGMWIPWTFEWELSSDKIIWQRFESTEQKRYTFHIGVSGRVANKWIDLWRLRPMFILGLAADWNEITGGRYTESFKVPPYCKQSAAYRHFAFCNSAPPYMRYCQGYVRYGCSEFNHPNLRDPYNYRLQCDRLLRRSLASKKQPLVPPFCDFCSNLMKAQGSYTPSKIKLLDKKCDTSLRLKKCSPLKCDYVQAV